MSDVTVNVRVTRDDAALQAFRNALADRRQLHAKVAVEAAEFTRDYLRKTGRHATADRLRAKPSGHRARIARQVQADSNDEAALIRIPRATGIGRAFHDMLIVPGSGRRFLTIPADARTYGKRSGEFAIGTFVFTIVGGRYPALMFRDGWTVAYWLARQVTQKQDRTLLPSDEAYAEAARRSMTVYFKNLVASQSA